jgi:ketosteroid isomerase-like protein
MNRLRFVVMTAFLVASCGTALAGPGSTPADPSADEAAIRKIDLAWSHAGETKNLDAFVAPYASDGSVLPFNAPIATGTAAIRQVWSGLMSKPGFSLRFAPTEIVVAKSHDLAWELGTFALKLDDAQGNSTTILGKYVVTWRKVGKTWKVAADIFNTDK